MNVRIPCQTLVSGFWQFPIVLYAFLTFPLPLWSWRRDFFLHVISSRSKNMMDCIYHQQWWNCCWDFLYEKKPKPFEWRRDSSVKNVSWFLARKFKQFYFLILTFFYWFWHEHSVWKLLKISHFNFEFWHFLPIFVLFKLTCEVTFFDRKLSILKNSPK